MRDTKGRFIKGATSPRKGVTLSVETKLKLSLSHKGKVAWNKGLKTPQYGGENHYLWKGEDANYRAIHQWLIRNFGKADHCDKNKRHGRKMYHWANKSGEYKRDISDWWQLCPSCNQKDNVHVHPRFL